MKTLVPAVFLSLSAAIPAFALDVSTCPIVVPPGEVGVVQADFECDGGPEEEIFGIVLKRGARLELNGHTITGSLIGLIQCEWRCEVAGPGNLVAGTHGGGIWVEALGRAYVHDIAMSGFGLAIVAPRGDVHAVNVSIAATYQGIASARRVELDNVQVTVPGDGWICIEAPQAGSRVKGKDVTVSGCEYGVYGTRRVELSNLSVSDSRIGVFSAGRVLLTDSDVTGSEYVDIYAGRRPQLVNTTCDRSLKYNPLLHDADGSWNACPGE